ncbi:glycosyltransferase family 9 protein [Halobacteriovorax sp.]|uniref:glycosyltransferase family 9 protein n=1 Tax=Halobacteriovorax sp. TaxID=2020862 RepID=UPI00356B3F37
METAKQDNTDIPPETVKKTIAIVQILRLGDIIQTIQTAKSLRQEHGDKYKLLLIARKKFANHLLDQINEVFDECITIDLKDLVLKSETVNLENSLNNIRELKAKISSHNIDVCVNLSYSKTANYLMSLITASHKIGPYYNENANLNINDKWSQYLYANVLETSLNSFNLVDLYKLIIGVSPKEDSSNIVKTGNKNKVFIHPFASDKKKVWGDSKWVEVIFKFLRDNESKEVFLVGAKNDQEACKKIINNPLLQTYNNRINDLTGKHNITELKELLDDDSMFIGHDSMVSHLASLKKVPIITISLGTVRTAETVPYIAGAYNLSPQTKCFPCKPDTACDFYQCHADIPYQTVNEALTIVSNGEELTKESLNKKLSHFHLNSINITKSAYNSLGLLSLESVLENEATYDETIRKFFTITWSYLVSEIEGHNEFPKISDKTHQRLLTDMKGLQQLFELSEFGKKYSRYILEEISCETPNLNKIKDYSKKVDEIERLSDIVSETHPQLSPIINYGKVARANLHGDNLVQLTESSFYSFHDQANATSIMYELCEKTLTQNQKNKTVKPQTTIR